MRVLGFSKRWAKLLNQNFTTFRYSRMDKDWFAGERVQIVIQPRRKGGGDKLGIAEILSIEPREFDLLYFKMTEGRCAPMMTDAEAQEDGFRDLPDMVEWLEKTYGRLDWMPCMNKLTLQWITREPAGIEESEWK